MKALWQQFEELIGPIRHARDELNSGASRDAITDLETTLDIKLPDDIVASYLLHDGQKGIYALFGEFTLLPIKEMLELNVSGRKSITKEYRKVHDDSGVIKDCVASPNWIYIGDNGGNTILYVDLDPGQQGTCGQLIAACDGEPEFVARSFREFFAKLLNDIQYGTLTWDHDDGGFAELLNPQEESTEQKKFKQHVDQAMASPDYDDLKRMAAGKKVMLIGAIKPNHKTSKHLLYLKGGTVNVFGPIPHIRLGLGSAGSPVAVKIKIEIGKPRFLGLLGLLGLLAPEYRIISCERLE